MINSDFDKTLRDRLYDLEEPVEADMWSAIQSKMAHRARMRVIRKVCLYVPAAAAACLVAGLFFFNDSTVPAESSNISSIVAQSNTAIPSNTIELVEPVQQSEQHHQEHFSNNSVVANIYAAKTGEEDVVPMTEQVKTLENVTAEAVSPKENTSTNNQQEIQEASAEAIYNIPPDFWDDPEDATKPDRRNTIISVSSNIASSSTSRGTGSMPMYAPSKLGERAAQTIPAPLREGDTKYYMPLSFGINFKTAIAGDFSVGAGLSYTYIVTKYDAVLNTLLYENTYNQLHYIGIPVNFYYDWSVGESNLVNLYAFAGGAIEKCVDSRYVYGSNAVHDNVAGFQYSVNAGFGLEYWFIPRLALYFDPSIVYYFENNQPINIRTDQPLQMHAEVGLRFKL